jgi:DNA-binding response OmpR family regulator
MARVLILEPHPDIRRLLELVVRRLGHEPVVLRNGDPDPDDVEAAVIDLGDGKGLLLARRLRDAGCPVVLTSIYPADDAARSVRPAAYLVKPYPLHKLERALGSVVPVAA